MVVGERFERGTSSRRSQSFSNLSQHLILRLALECLLGNFEKPREFLFSSTYFKGRHTTHQQLTEITVFATET